MPVRNYCHSDVSLSKGSPATAKVRELQADLRALGYLRAGIDGDFGRGTELAVKGLQYDLLHNDGASSQNDGKAPVSVRDFNRGRVAAVTGIVDFNLAECISDMLDHPGFPALPKTDDPEGENKKIVSLLKMLTSTEVPIPFLTAILKRESGLRHFHEPAGDDQDTYITVGLDRNADEEHIITSRGYGVGQYTLFHHPPTAWEIKDFMLDVESNVRKAVQELNEKFKKFVNGSSSGTRADDRIAELGKGPLIACRHAPGDPKFMRDCRTCAENAGQHDIKLGETTTYETSSVTFVPTQYYPTSHEAVPVRRNIGCDWPYAARRYNGSGVNSYHYQAIILKNLLELP